MSHLLEIPIVLRSIALQCAYEYISNSNFPGDWEVLMRNDVILRKIFQGNTHEMKAYLQFLSDEDMEIFRNEDLPKLEEILTEQLDEMIKNVNEEVLEVPYICQLPDECCARSKEQGKLEEYYRTILYDLFYYIFALTGLILQYYVDDGYDGSTQIHYRIENTRR